MGALNRLLIIDSAGGGQAPALAACFGCRLRPGQSGKFNTANSLW